LLIVLLPLMLHCRRRCQAGHSWHAVAAAAAAAAAMLLPRFRHCCRSAANALPRRCHRCQRAVVAAIALPAAMALPPPPLPPPPPPPLHYCHHAEVMLPPPLQSHHAACCAAAKLPLPSPSCRRRQLVGWLFSQLFGWLPPLLSPSF
jgi:hypothetical protein